MKPSKATPNRRPAPSPEPQATRLAALCLLLFACCLFPACGRRRPPQPPVEGVPQRTELLSGVQRGNQVILSWPAPRRNAPDGSVQSIRRVDVYRLAEGVDDPVALTEEEFSARSTVVGSVTYEEIERSAGTLNYTDELTLTEPVRLRYAVRYVNAANQRAAFSNFLVIEPAARVSQPPALDPSPVVTQEAVRLRWQAPAANVDASTPANLLGYNVYRVDPTAPTPAREPLNPAPLTETGFADLTFEFGREYSYVVRAVSLGTGGEPVESLNSNAVSVRPLDTFPPSAPEGLTAVATPAPRRISVFFAAGKEADVAGYHVHRATDPDLPKEQWPRLTSAPLTRTTLQDDTVEPGRRYYYYVTAVDRAGNASPPSAVASDLVP